MSNAVREAIEQREAQWLSPYAAKSAESKGRSVPEKPDSLRTAFMRDRDRIIHSKPFRRLKHKTQVFISATGDHYRTRLTHTLEVAQIARTIGRALRLNEDLIEAIALGHDVGHTPFGHAGEAALDEAIKELEGRRSKDEGRKGRRDQGTERQIPDGFKHFEQSLRVLEVLEGLNLTFEVKSGIAGHSKGRADLSEAEGEKTSTLEAAVVRISDRIAYLNHDLDDALRAGILSELPSIATRIGKSHSKRITAMVQDAIHNSMDSPAVRLSPSMTEQMNDLKDWMFENVYEAPALRSAEIEQAKRTVKALFFHYCEPGNLPQGFSGVQGAIDYVAGMTDRFAIESLKKINA